MEAYVGSFVQAVFGPIFSQTGLGAVIAGLAVFIVGWIAFMAVTGRRE